jgi:hypothetical protein
VCHARAFTSERTGAGSGFTKVWNAGTARAMDKASTRMVELFPVKEY